MPHPRGLPGLGWESIQGTLGNRGSDGGDLVKFVLRLWELMSEHGVCCGSCLFLG